MKAKKLISAVIAAMMALGTFAALPAETGSPAVLTAEAKSYSTIPDFNATPGNRSVALSWGKVSGTYLYSVYYREENEEELIWYKNLSSTSCNITGLKSGTGYDFYIAAWNSNSEIIAEALVTGIVPSDKNNVSENGFVISTDNDGLKYVASYKGSGGSIKIPTTVDYIAEDAFKDNTNITEVTIPSNCFLIGESAFEGCTKLKKVVCQGLISVGNTAFLRCFNLKTVEFKSGSADIGVQAFQHCQSLEKVTFDKSSKWSMTIGSSAFYGCVSLKSINIPDNCEYICPLAFVNCYSLSEIQIPGSTKFYYSGDNAHIGYFYAAKTEDNAWDQKYYLGKADGKTSVYYDAVSNLAVSKRSEKLGDMYLYMKKYTPVKVTMIVVKDSHAEDYAKKYKIPYKYASETSSSSSEKLDAPENFRASKKTATSMTLAWDDVEGADAYAVYMYSSKTGKYEKYKTVQSAKCAVSSLKKGTKYKFKVVALDKVNGKYKSGAFSDVLTVSTKSA